jgi:hypothetical protein
MMWCQSAFVLILIRLYTVVRLEREPIPEFLLYSTLPLNINILAEYFDET